jgi:predicted metal-dependent HD superfamily phosphohydrolase
VTRERWGALWLRLGAAGDAATAFADLCQRYGEPQRVYHTMAHVGQLLVELDTVRGNLQSPDRVEMAGWLHDVVYAARLTDNEERSAAYARSLLEAAGIDRDGVEEVGELILATRHAEFPASQDAALLVDADLTILGQPESAFDAYDRQIRMEYSWVSEAEYNVGRGAVLRRFLEREAVFWTEAFRKRYETQARANLLRALSRLSR